ncbi:hypothetical protein DRQ11_14950 [candidate division KSB1 bacterium]|nr:MAG: hypothetical protein DRQ11_14950 [candidate division KSB1 bacterium]
MTNTKAFSDSSKILEIFKQNNIYSLWHFTDIRNLSLIKTLNGLRSKEFLENKGYLKNVICGGNELSHQLDRELGNWDKISLNFTPHTPMVFHKKKELHLIFIEIDPVVATFEDVYFTDCNATRRRNGQIREKEIKGLLSIKFDMINGAPKPYDSDWIKYVQAEVLVPHHIPVEYFKKIHFISEASLRLGEYLWSGNHPIFTVTPEVFADYHGHSWAIINPYLDKIIITDEEITKDNVENAHPDVGNIMRDKRFWMKIYLFATAGTKARVILKDLHNNIIKEVETEFEKESNWWWFPNFRIPAEYPHAELILEITLDGILWYKEKRKVLK